MGSVKWTPNCISFETQIWSPLFPLAFTLCGMSCQSTTKIGTGEALPSTPSHIPYIAVYTSALSKVQFQSTRGALLASIPTCQTLWQGIDRIVRTITSHQRLTFFTLFLYTGTTDSCTFLRILLSLPRTTSMVNHIYQKISLHDFTFLNPTFSFQLLLISNVFQNV